MMPLVVVVVLSSLLTSLSAADANNHQQQQLLEYQPTLLPSIPPNSNSIETNPADQSNEILKGPIYPVYKSQKSTFAPSTQLRQVMNAVNFSPMINSPPAPVIMQYLPQNQLPGGGLHYLQLIPTRPLIVPISPYISQLANSYQQQSPTISTSSSTSTSSLSPSPSQPSYHPSAVSNHASRSTITNSSPLAVVAAPTYAMMPPNLRYFRQNAGVKMVKPPDDLSLNTNEYIPRPGDNTPTRIIRGRP